MIAETTALIFQRAGFETCSASSAEQALTLMGTWPAQVAVIDVHLPGMNGVDLAIRFKAEYPDCKVILFSGDPGTIDLLDDARRGGHDLGCLAKPVNPREFLSLVSDLLS